ncbi:MAG: thioesterase [Leptolyngbyaceae cyanobacterium SL_5_9]|nr:thioesterase [Leptolyngbyaceae cyanobacterium SL_5_9]NJO73583.1 thioesterase [Leptolyngbyaceae cyanobacterium RM1_406_9]
MKTIKANPWITCPQPNPQAKLRLFCLPYAGGGASGFRDWPAQLSSLIEVCPIELPGRGSRFQEPPYTRLAPLIQDLTPALLPYLNIPFAFFGHSMGALVSFELTQFLSQTYGLTPACLAVAGRPAPHLSDRSNPIHALPDSDFLEKIRDFNGTPAPVLANAELMRILLPMLRADFAVIETFSYTPRPLLNCAIAAFGGLHDPKVSCADLEAWREQTHSTFLLHLLSGDHFFIHSAQSQLLSVLEPILHQTALSSLPFR